jgi:hypothetical protein
MERKKNMKSVFLLHTLEQEWCVGTPRWDKDKMAFTCTFRSIYLHNVDNAKGTKLGHGLTLKSLKITQLKLDKRHHPLLLI